jgi:phospholipase C
MSFNRRDFLRGVAGLSATAVLESALSQSEAQDWTVQDALIAPGRSGIEHIVVVMMENRSFDHKLGWLPGADGKQEGLSYQDPNGAFVSTHPLAPDFAGCGLSDPDHSYNGGRIEYNQGAMNGFLLDSANDPYAIGYYREQDLPFFSALARSYTACDRAFCSILAPTFPNRFFLHAAQTDRLENTIAIATMPTIWDRLSASHVSAHYYFSNIPFVALWGTKYLAISRLYSQFLTDAASGNLPAVAFVDPKYTLSDTLRGNDDHPHADVRAGDAFLADTFFALANGPKWHNTVLIITYDEWGGFFDHVPPPRATAANNVDTDIQNGKTLLGFRIPVVIASPFTRSVTTTPRVVSSVFDHTSILKLIEWRWGLQPLTPRDASTDISNMLLALKLAHPDTSIPSLPHPVAPPPGPCTQTLTSNGATVPVHGDWMRLIQSGLLQGWPVQID